MKYHARTVVAVCLTVLVLGLAEAKAEQATSFEQLQVLVKTGDTVSVVAASGQISKGRIAGLSESSMRLLVDGVPRDLPESAVLEVRQRRSDSVANGARYGALVGGGVGLAAGLLASAISGPAVGVVVGCFFTGIGAGVGIGVDALIVPTRVVYRVGVPNSTRFNVTPFLQGTNKGIKLSLSF